LVSPYNRAAALHCKRKTSIAHEEVDTRIILHPADAVSKGFQKILLHTVDTDVVVLAVAAATRLDIQELWASIWDREGFQVYVSS